MADFKSKVGRFYVESCLISVHLKNKNYHFILVCIFLFQSSLLHSIVFFESG